MAHKRADVLQRQLNSKQFAKLARPQWVDHFRGILCAFMENRPNFWKADLQNCGVWMVQTSVLSEFAASLKTVDELFEETIILEKWAWMCAMLQKSRAITEAAVQSGCPPPDPWRYCHAMDFLGPTPVNIKPFVDLLTPDRFEALCNVYPLNQNDRDVIARSRIVQCAANRVKRGRPRGLARNSETASPPNKVTKLDSVKFLTPEAIQLLMPNLLAAAPGPSLSVKTEPMEEKEEEKATAIASTSNHVALSIKKELKEHDEEEDEEEEGEEEMGGGDEEEGPPTMVRPRGVEMPRISDADRDCAVDVHAGDGPAWTDIIVDDLVNRVRMRRSFWDDHDVSSRSAIERRDAITEITKALNTAHGTNFSESDVALRWSHILQSFKGIIRTRRNSVSTENGDGKFYKSMQFLLEDRMAASNRAPKVSPPPLAKSESPTAKAGGKASSPNGAKIFEGGPISLADLQMNGEGPSTSSSSSTAMAPLARIQSLVNGPAPPLGGFPPLPSAVNGRRKTTSNGVQPTPIAPQPLPRPANVIIDSWHHLGEMIAHAGREMEARDPRRALDMQNSLFSIALGYRKQEIDSAAQQ